VRLDHAAMLVSAAMLAAAVYLVLYRSRFGLGLRAIVGNPTAAHLVGIDVRLATLGAFGLASAVGGFAGYLVLAVDQQVTPMFGMWATFKGLIAMMLGGLGSIPGALLGGLLLGVIEAHAQWHFGPQIRDLLTYAVLFLVLVVRPTGLMGEALPPEAGALGRA
jgi:branched-chain amino acid transport system permease protein